MPRKYNARNTRPVHFEKGPVPTPLDVWNAARPLEVTDVDAVSELLRTSTILYLDAAKYDAIGAYATFIIITREEGTDYPFTILAMPMHMGCQVADLQTGLDAFPFDLSKFRIIPDTTFLEMTAPALAAMGIQGSPSQEVTNLMELVDDAITDVRLPVRAGLQPVD